jgi:putative sterol carrier protein
VRGIEIESAAPLEIYAAVAAMEEPDFEALMEDLPSRGRVIDALIDHMTSLFRPEQADGLDAAIHVKLWDHPDGGYEHFEIVIADGTLIHSREPNREADLTLKIRPTDLRKLVTGETRTAQLALKGRLRVVGDLGLALRLPELFDFSR